MKMGAAIAVGTLAFVLNEIIELVARESLVFHEGPREFFFLSW